MEEFWIAAAWDNPVEDQNNHDCDEQSTDRAQNEARRSVQQMDVGPREVCDYMAQELSERDSSDNKKAEENQRVFPHGEPAATAGATEEK